MRRSFTERAGLALALALVSALNLACEGTSDFALVTTRLEQPIQAGEAPRTRAHDAVVSLHSRFGDLAWRSVFCSGTLIAPDVVLTAAHCLDTAGWGDPGYVEMAPEDVAVYLGDAPWSDPEPLFLPVRKARIFDDYDPGRTRNDIALLRLGLPVPRALVEPVPPLPAALALGEDDIGALLNFAGFGADEEGASGVKLQVDGALGGFGCAVEGCPSEGDPSTQLSYAQREGGPCFGDSGGPAFVERDGETYVAGVTSWGDALCERYGVSTRVDAFESFLRGFTGPR